ncbi:MAG: transporter substrate-binding domain-containing protein [bacterium]|nr:transporter substrate-binding domain-containing protein [bacterium]
MNSKSSAVTWATGLALIAIAVSVVAIAKVGKSGSSASTQRDSLAEIQKSKVMDVCVAEWPPFSVKDAATGKYSGVDIDAMEAMGKALGATVSYHDTTFGNMPAAIQSGTCDIGTSLYVTPSRSAAIDFARPVLYGGDTALVRKGETRFKTLDDLDKTGIKVATATGESGDIYAKANFTKATVTSIDVPSSDQTSFLLEVTSGRADIGIADSYTIANFAKAHPETAVVFTEKPFNLSPDAYGVRHSDTNLLNFMNNTILSMQANGIWDSIEKKYNATAFHQNLDIK